MKLRDASLQLYENTSFTHPLSCILPFNEVGKCQPRGLRKKLFHTFSFMYFAFQWSCEMPVWKFTKKTLSHILFHVFCLSSSSMYFLRMYLDYFFRRSFESVRAQFLSAESSITYNLPVQSRFIWVNYLHVEYGIWRSLECSFCQINWNPSFLVI